MDYTRIPCPVCKKPFNSNDDIVVCPVCGAPYHRDCYKEAGHCIFVENHESGKDWTPPALASASINASSEIKDVECTICGTLNPKSAMFCNGCGTLLSKKPEALNDDVSVNPYMSGGNQHGNPYNQSGMPPMFMGGFPVDPMGGVSPTEEIDENVSFGDVSKLVRQGTAYYLPVFKRIKAQGKGKFNFSAFIFSGGWMLYRKQYKRGIIFSLIMLALFIGYALSTLYISAPILGDLMLQIGMNPQAAQMPNYNEWLAITNILAKDGWLFLQFSTPLIALLLMLITGITSGIMANKWYMRHCIKTVQYIKHHESLEGGSDYEHRGGVNTPLGIALLLFALLLTYLPVFL